MRILLFDPFHGAAGDMIIGALLDCGADESTVLRAMGATVAKPSISAVTRAGIRALLVKTHAAPSHRSFDEVMARLDSAAPALPPEVPELARRVFGRIRAAEERVHGEKAHFHEVGADDAIADVIGACTALSTLRVDSVAVLPVAVGRGKGAGSHGTFPVPAPATANILAQSGLAVRTPTGDGELCTPTGAALLAEFSSLRPADLGAYTIASVGYGAGTRDTPGTPNVLRAMVLETAGSLQRDTVDILETNVDDVSGEVIAGAISRFMDSGARDASAVPIIMKKGRPGFLIRVISPPERSSSLAALMARELGTLGIRCTPAVHRFIAERTIGQVPVEIEGEERTMPVKYGFLDGEVYTVKAEFKPAQEWADELGMPVREVTRRIEDAGRRTIPEPPGSRVAR